MDTMQKTQPAVAVILLNWNNEQDTVDCVDSLRRISYSNFHIFLVDNHSREDSVTKLRSLQNETLTLVENKENLGYSGGNNAGIARALKENFEYVLLLNNDTTVKTNFLEKLIEVAKDSARVGIVGPKIYFYYDKNKIWFGGGIVNWFSDEVHAQYGVVDTKPNEACPKKTQYMTGCALLVKTKVIHDIGMLDDDFFLYYEDMDWSLRARKAGYTIMYAPASHVYHKITQSVAPIGNPKIHYYHERNFLLVAKRNAPPLLLPFIYIRSTLRYVKQIIKLVVMPSKREVSRMIMKGIGDFYRGQFGKINNGTVTKYGSLRPPAGG